MSIRSASSVSHDSARGIRSLAPSCHQRRNTGSTSAAALIVSEVLWARRTAMETTLARWVAGHPIPVGKHAHPRGNIHADEGWRTVERVQQRRPPVQGIDDVSDTSSWPRKVEVDKGCWQAVPKDNVPRTVVLMRHEFRFVKQRDGA